MISVVALFPEKGKGIFLQKSQVTSDTKVVVVVVVVVPPKKKKKKRLIKTDLGYLDKKTYFI